MHLQGEILVDKQKLINETEVDKSFFTQLEYHLDVAILRVPSFHIELTNRPK
jgi:hypothetical protein